MSEQEKTVAELYSNYHKTVMGQNGMRKLDNAAISPAGEIYAVLKAVEDTTFSCSIVRSRHTRGDHELVNVTILAGDTLPGVFKDVEVSAGVLIAYF